MGRYDSDELGTSYGVELRDSTLIATHRRHGDIVLTPLARDEFRGGAWFAASVQFVRDRTGAVSGLRISNGRALNLEFTKVGR